MWKNVCHERACRWPVVVPASAEGLETCFWEGRRQPLVTSCRRPTTLLSGISFLSWDSLAFPWGTFSLLKAWLPSLGAQGGDTFGVDQHLCELVALVCFLRSRVPIFLTPEIFFLISTSPWPTPAMWSLWLLAVLLVVLFSCLPRGRLGASFSCVIWTVRYTNFPVFFWLPFHISMV